MQLGWIYAFRDRGFERGIKIGQDKNHPDRYRCAQCYTPRGIDLEPCGASTAASPAFRRRRRWPDLECPSCRPRILVQSAAILQHQRQ